LALLTAEEEVVEEVAATMADVVTISEQAPQLYLLLLNPQHQHHLLEVGKLLEAKLEREEAVGVEEMKVEMHQMNPDEGAGVVRRIGDQVPKVLYLDHKNSSSSREVEVEVEVS